MYFGSYAKKYILKVPQNLKKSSTQLLKSTQYKKLAPNALGSTHLKSCKPHEKTKKHQYAKSMGKIE